MKGGTAIDAAIAANATLGLMKPTGNGIGGDYSRSFGSMLKRNSTVSTPPARSPQSLSFEPCRPSSRNWIAKPSLRLDHFLSRYGLRRWLVRITRSIRQALPCIKCFNPPSTMRAKAFRIGADSPTTGVEAEGLDAIQAFEKPFCRTVGLHEKVKCFATRNSRPPWKQIGQQGRDAFYRGPIAERIAALWPSMAATYRSKTFAIIEANGSSRFA